jgi:hypothetical protein
VPRKLGSESPLRIFRMLETTVVRFWHKADILVVLSDATQPTSQRIRSMAAVRGNAASASLASR